LSVTNSLKIGQSVGGAKRPPKGWSPERRTRQAALIRSWQPWRRSTGPKTEAGKARCSMNGLKHGVRSRARIEEYRRVRNAIRMAALNNAILRAFIRVRDGRPNLKPIYEMRLLMAKERLRQFLEKLRPEKISISNDQTFESGNSATRPISYDRATKHPARAGGSLITSSRVLERRTVLPRWNGVRGGPPKIA
jgi:hypothetical protein